MRVFGIDPGSVRTGYGCVETDGTRHRLVTCGVLSASGAARVSDAAGGHPRRPCGRPSATSAPDCVAIENLFHARQCSQRARARSRARRRGARGRPGRAAARRIHARGDQAGGRRLRTGRKGTGAADGQAAARASTRRRRRTTPPTRWRSRFVTRRSRGRRALATPSVRARRLRSWRHVKLADVRRRPAP